jgi:hypothetical protein
MSGEANRNTRRTISSQLKAMWAVVASFENPVGSLDLHPSAFGKPWFPTLTSIKKWLHNRVNIQQKARELHVCESTQLGEKRFVALIQADGQRFLIGGTSNSISLLATLPARKTFRSLLPQDVPFEVRES